MKKALIIVGMSIVFMFTLCACSEKKEDNPSAQPNVDEIKNKIVESIEFPEMIEIGSEISEDSGGNTNSQIVGMKYDGLDISEFESYSITYAGDGACADEIVIIKVEAAEKADEIKNIFDNRVKERAGDFEGYAPLEFEKLNDAVVKTKGNYIFLAVCEDSGKAEKIFDESF